MSFSPSVFCRLRNASLPPLITFIRSQQLSTQTYTTKIFTIGKLHEPNHETDAYKPGQIFVHKTFNYRGVILHPWLARIYDKDRAKLKDATKIGETNEDVTVSQSKHQLYYQVLVDIRDLPHIRIDNPCVSYLQKRYSTQMIVKAGVDYVSHDDILPFSSTQKVKPIQHKWFDKFLCPEPESTEPSYIGTEDLRLFQEKNHSWLCLSKVYRETTENIRVTVIPFYMGKVDYIDQYWWRYCIRLENLGDEPVQLRERFLLIHSTPVSYEKLKARGVVGKEPRLTMRCPVFQYNSQVNLESDSGFMKGTYTMERPDGSMFEIKIPVVNLEKIGDLHNDNEDDISG